MALKTDGGGGTGPRLYFITLLDRWKVQCSLSRCDIKQKSKFRAKDQILFHRLGSLGSECMPFYLSLFFILCSIIVLRIPVEQPRIYNFIQKMKMNARHIVLLFSHKYDVLDYFYKKCTRWQKLCYSSLDSCCSHALKAWNKHIHPL